MAVVLAGFIGRPRTMTGAPASYKPTTYQFPALDGCAARQATVQLFNSALREHLGCMQRPPSRWLIMGTAQSQWDALLEVVPSDDGSDELIEVGTRVFDAIRAATLDQGLLDEWGASLSAHLSGTTVVCRLTGAAETVASQQSVLQALLDVVQEKDEIVFDITHGLRHQPTLAAFMAMLLRQLRLVARVDLYYGAWELHDESDIAPVLRLDYCSELLRATEALATWRQTGNYSALGPCLNLDNNIQADLNAVAFADETGQPHNGARKLLSQLEATPPIAEGGALQKEIKPMLQASLQWANRHNLALRWADKATFAIEHGNFLKAIVLLWEALKIAGCLRDHIDATGYRARKKGEDALSNHFNTTGNQQWQAIIRVRDLRNAVVHGTPGGDADVTRALSDAQTFDTIFKNGHAVLIDFLADYVG